MQVPRAFKKQSAVRSFRCSGTFACSDTRPVFPSSHHEQVIGGSQCWCLKKQGWISLLTLQHRSCVYCVASPCSGQEPHHTLTAVAHTPAKECVAELQGLMTGSLSRAERITALTLRPGWHSWINVHDGDTGWIAQADNAETFLCLVRPCEPGAG